MIGIPRIALAIQVTLAIALSITWLTMWTRQLYAKHWRQKHVQAPHYPDGTTQVLCVLQRLQLLYSDPTGVSLADIQRVILDLQQAHGEQATLEEVIQQIVGEQLQQQLRARRALRQRKALVAA